MTIPLFILTDARGFVTAIPAVHAQIKIEVERVKLALPLTVSPWYTRTEVLGRADKVWTAGEVFHWPS